MAKKLQIERTINGSILKNTPVLFDSVILSSNDITYSPSDGVITFNIPGSYIIHWDVDTTITANIEHIFDLFSSNYSNYETYLEYIYLDKEAGLVIVNVPAAGFTLQLNNTLTYTVKYSIAANPKGTLSIDTYSSNTPVTPTGATGATGATGTTGATGATGATATNSNSFAANTTGATVTVVVGGTNVPLPNNQLLSPDITVDNTNSIFTIANAGRYRISYRINTTAGVAVGSRLLVNGAGNVASTIPTPAATLSGFSGEVIIDATAGTTVSLQLFGAAASAILLNGGAGATLTIIKLS